MKKISVLTVASAIVVGFLINSALYVLTTSFEINDEQDPAIFLCQGYNNPEDAPIVKMRIQGGLPLGSTTIDTELRGNCMTNEDFQKLAESTLSKGDYLKDYVTKSWQFYANWFIWSAAAYYVVHGFRRLHAHYRS